MLQRHPEDQGVESGKKKKKKGTTGKSSVFAAIIEP
jgi:hypothetical protein